MYFMTSDLWPISSKPKLQLFIPIKVTAMSLKLEIRLHAHQVGTNTQSGTEVNFYAHLIGSCIQN